MKKATKTANISANIYEGAFDLNFDCVGETACRFALCFVMPPDGTDECSFRNHGSCICPQAKYAALEALRNRLTKELKEIADGFE